MGEIYRLDRAVVEISGTDAQRLLNDTLTADIKNLEPDVGRWFALLSPLGKVLVEGLVMRRQGSFWFDLPPAAREEFIKRLTLYRLRADVVITDRRASHGVGWSKTRPASGPSYRDGRHDSLGFRVIEATKTATGWPTETGEHPRLLAAAGIVELGTGFEAGTQFAHDIGMDEVGGIDFEKGCYIGQEIVSRMRHRGTARKRPVIVTAEQPLPAGATLTVNGKSVGKVCGGGDNVAVGLLRIDKITPDGVAMADDEPVSLTVPDWASYRFSESDTKS